MSSKAELEDIYSAHYKKVLIPLSLHPVANYIVQTMLDNCPTRDIAEEMCSELLPLVEDLLAESITGLFRYLIFKPGYILYCELSVTRINL